MAEELLKGDFKAVIDPHLCRDVPKAAHGYHNSGIFAFMKEVSITLFPTVLKSTFQGGLPIGHINGQITN